MPAGAPRAPGGPSSCGCTRRGLGGATPIPGLECGMPKAQGGSDTGRDRGTGRERLKSKTWTGTRDEDLECEMVVRDADQAEGQMWRAAWK